MTKTLPSSRHGSILSKLPTSDEQVQAKLCAAAQPCKGDTFTTSHSAQAERSSGVAVPGTDSNNYITA